MTEADLQSILGISDIQLRVARETFPAHWHRAAHGEIHWNDDTIDDLLTYLSEKKDAVLTVTRRPVNRRAIYATDGTTEHLVQSVRNNNLLVPGQLIRAAKQKDGHWHWQGPHPTKKGQLLIRS